MSDDGRFQNSVVVNTGLRFHALVSWPLATLACDSDNFQARGERTAPGAVGRYSSTKTYSDSLCSSAVVNLVSSPKCSYCVHCVLQLERRCRHDEQGFQEGHRHRCSCSCSRSYSRGGRGMRDLHGPTQDPGRALHLCKSRRGVSPFRRRGATASPSRAGRPGTIPPFASDSLSCVSPLLSPPLRTTSSATIAS